MVLFVKISKVQPATRENNTYLQVKFDILDVVAHARSP